MSTHPPISYPKSLWRRENKVERVVDDIGDMFFFLVFFFFFSGDGVPRGGKIGSRFFANQRTGGKEILKVSALHPGTMEPP